MTKKRFIFITMLTITICIMSLGYAALQEKIDITGGASVDSVYRVEITKVEKTETTGSATEKDIPNYTGLTANFSVGLTQTNDSITYNITVSNLGTVDVKLNNTTVTTEGSDKVSVLKTGINNGDIILAGESKTLTVKIKYDGTDLEEEISATAKLIFDYTRLKGGSGDVVTETTLAYLIGDTVNFAGSNWYVIKDSSVDEDYVTLMKETVLTSEELGEYAANYTRTCTANDVTNGSYGCTTEGETVIEKKNAMSYYWSDTCHLRGNYGYTDTDFSGCSGHNDYEGSKVKEYLEGTYINTLGSDKLKEVDGYKIRLITLNELQTNLGYDTEMTDSYYKQNDEATPSWLYQNDKYYTMTPNPDYNITVFGVNADGAISMYIYDRIGIRPVINLLKSSI